jgi:hypothetical protein
VNRARSTSSIGVLASLVLAAVVLSGCFPRNTRAYSPEEVDIGPCEVLGDITSEDISEGSRASCDLATARFVFPDGVASYVPGILNSRAIETPESPKYTYFTDNLGIYGVVASRAEREKQTDRASTGGEKKP